jgi:hypothetical protein
MNNTPSVKVRLSTYIRWSGAVAMLGGVLFILASAAFAFTHGTQSQAQFGTLFGLTRAQYAKVFQPTIWLSFLIGVMGVNAILAERAKQLGKIGFITSALGYGLAAVNWILQDANLVYGGFLLSLLAILIQTVGMTLFGLALMRAKALPRWNGLPLLIGLLLLATGVFQSFVSDTSDGSLVWSLIYISASVPYSLCWMLLGYSVWSHKHAA